MQILLDWLVAAALNWLKAWAIQAVIDKRAQMEKDKQQGITNEANTIAYEAAKDREERIRAATDLLNRNRK